MPGQHRPSLLLRPIQALSFTSEAPEPLVYGYWSNAYPIHRLGEPRCNAATKKLGPETPFSNRRPSWGYPAWTKSLDFPESWSAHPQWTKDSEKAAKTQRNPH